MPSSLTGVVYLSLNIAMMQIRILFFQSGCEKPKGSRKFMGTVFSVSMKYSLEYMFVVGRGIQGSNI